MYYEESWINGKLSYRTTPDGTWYTCTMEQCWRRIRELQDELSQTRRALASAEQRVDNAIDVVDKIRRKM